MDKSDLKIWLTKQPSSPYWQIRYISPETGVAAQKSTGTVKKKDAERILGELRADLLNHRYQPTSNISWQSFRERYRNEVMSSLAEKTQMKIETVLDSIQKVLHPSRLGDLTTQRLSYYQAKLRDGDRSENTISGYLAHLRAALNWAVSMGLLARLPEIRKPKRATVSKVMKGRPITQEEFERMLEKTEQVVGTEANESWKQYLEGLWWSGLRLAESLDLFWDDDGKLQVVFMDEEPMLKIPAAMEKGNKNRLLPIAPEFADFLTRTPKHIRKGRVFKLKPRKARGERLTADRVTHIVSKIGREAKVVVDKSRNKFATAHDLRRSFGERWAARVMPQVLMELMRHESIDTTLKFYVGRNAQRTSKVLREAYLKSQSDRGVKTGGDKKRETSRETRPEPGNLAENQNPEEPGK